RAMRIVVEGRVLADAMHRVDAESVHAAVEPEIEYAVHRTDHFGMTPVQVRLFRQKKMQVVLPGALVQRPRTARAEGGDPVVGAVAPDVPVAFGVVARGA